MYPFWQKSFDDRGPGFPEALPKGRAHRVVRAADDEVYDLNGCEDDHWVLAHPREGLREEVIIERAHDLLLARRVCAASMRWTIAR